MSGLRAFAHGLWEFLVGEDWRTALGVAGAIALTALVSAGGGAAWWVLPLAVFALLSITVRRAVLKAVRNGSRPGGARERSG